MEQNNTFRVDTSGLQGENRGFQHKIARIMPLGPAIMTVKNKGEEQRRFSEMVELGVPSLGSVKNILDETEELCSIYERLQPEYAFYWQRAVELIYAHAKGAKAGIDMVKKWGFVKDKRLGVALPEWWDGKMIVPLEFMDYCPENYSDEAVRSIGANPERFRILAKRASDRAWIGYYRAKGCLKSENVSLLIKDVTDTAIMLKDMVEKPKHSPYVVYVIGISEDEVAALSNPDTCIIGFNRGYSPIIEKLIQNGKITQLAISKGHGDKTAKLVYADTQEEFSPVGGKIFICPGDVNQGLPVSDASGITMTNYTLHHNSFKDQEIMIRELNRTAMPTKNGGRAWVAGEMLRNWYFIPTLFGPVSTVGPTLWDAWTSFANGVVCVDYHEKRREEWADEGIHLRFTQVPKSLVSAPSFVQKFLMSPTKTLITGC